MAERPRQSGWCKKRCETTRQPHLHTEPMAEWRNIPSVSGGDRMDGDVRQVPWLHLHGCHQAWTALPTTTSLWEHALHDKCRIPILKQDQWVNKKIVDHQQMLLSAFNETRAKVYLNFR